MGCAGSKLQPRSKTSGVSEEAANEADSKVQPRSKASGVSEEAANEADSKVQPRSKASGVSEEAANELIRVHSHAPSDKVVVHAPSDSDKVMFYFVRADKLRDAGRVTMPNMQTILKERPDWIVKESLSLKEAILRNHVARILVVSHRWETRDEPDGQGVQCCAIQSHLKAHPDLELVWYDYWCMPQGNRTAEEKTEFDRMLPEINLLYLGASVLLIVDMSYVSRFWTQFEAWLSFMICTSDGLVPSQAEERRSTVACIHNAPTYFAQLLIDLWSKTTSASAREILAKPDVSVTNQRDKDIQLPKITEINERVQQMVESTPNVPVRPVASMQVYEEHLYSAKVFEQCELYEQMLEHIVFCARHAPDGKAPSMEVRNIFSVAFKHCIGPKRDAFRIVVAILAKEKEKDKDKDKLAHLKQIMGQVFAEIESMASRLLSLIDEEGLDDARHDAETRTFFLKMRGDYHKYVLEAAQAIDKDGEQVMIRIRAARAAYANAAEFAAKQLAVTHPIRLGLALNYAVFLHDNLGDTNAACALAKTAFDDAIAELDTLDEESYKDSTLIMQLLRDNLTGWTSDDD